MHDRAVIRNLREWSANGPQDRGGSKLDGWLEAHRVALESISHGRSLETCLEEICRVAERVCPGVRAAVLLTDNISPHVCRLIAPSVPALSDAVMRTLGAERSGSVCPLLVALHEPQTCVDIENDPRWEGEWGSLALSAGVRAAYVAPVVGDGGRVLGSVLLAFDRPTRPSASDERDAAIAAGLVGLTLQSKSWDSGPSEDERCARQVIESMAVAVYTTDALGRITMYNDAAVKLWGRAPEPGDLWCGSLRIFRADGSPLPLDQCPMAEALRGGRPVVGEEIVIERPDGTRRDALPHPRPLFDASGAVIGAVNMIVDITQHKVAEQRLRESEQRFRTCADAAPAMLWMTDPDGSCTFLSRGWYEYTGQTEPEALGFGWFTAVHPEDREASVAAFRHATAHRTPFALDQRVRRADGEHRWVIDAGRPHFGPEGEFLGFVGSVIDVHERKETERALRESEERFRTLADNMSQFAWMADRKGWIFWYNQRWYDYTGTTLSEMEGWGWKKVHHPEHVERVEAWIRRSFETGEPWEDIFPLRSKDGEYRWFLSRAMPIRDERGEIVRWFGTNTDITERREMEQQLAQHKSELESRVEERTRELKATHERLRMSERMAMMGTLSAGLGHDMGNLLLPVRVRLESLAAQPLSEQAREDVEAIRTSAEYLRQLANGLRLVALDPARASPGEVTDVRAWWADAQGVLKSALARGVTLDGEIGSGAPHVSMSKAALTQVVFNLVQNACDAVAHRGSGRIVVRVRSEGTRVFVSVEDDGPGMSPEVRARCMEPYYSTKTRGISTGLGLVLVHGLVQEARGEVEIRSAPGVGTTITLALPSAPAPEPDDADAPARRAVVHVRDARMRSFISGELRSLRYETVSVGAHSGSAELFVIDDEDQLVGVPESARVIFLGESAGQGVRSLGEKPAIATIREALRETARSGAVVVRDRDSAANRRVREG